MTSYGMSISHINVELKNWLKYGGGDGHQDVGDDAGTFYVLISCIYAFLWYVYLTYDSWWFYHNVCGVCVGGGGDDQGLCEERECDKPVVDGIAFTCCRCQMDIIRFSEDYENGGPLGGDEEFWYCGLCLGEVRVSMCNDAVERELRNWRWGNGFSNAISNPGSSVRWSI